MARPHFRPAPEIDLFLLRDDVRGERRDVLERLSLDLEHLVAGGGHVAVDGAGVLSHLTVAGRRDAVLSHVGFVAGKAAPS